MHASGKVRTWFPFFVGLFVMLAYGTGSSRAQIGSDPKQEFRAAWIATVGNYDWPDGMGYSADSQKAQLILMLDRLKAAGINAVLLQVRDESDAFFPSPYEPWSVYLTGVQGRDPGYDPLAFAIEEAHKRGMELHAWINPYRVWSASRPYQRDQTSPYLSKPDWLLTIKTVVILNPGIPDVRAYLIDIITDIVTRYDVDGIHFDDYFYPYERITTEDTATFQAYGLSFGSIGVFRTYSVNMLVRGVHEAIERVKPEVKFGISPFGIWKSGTPPGITGLSGATELYADAVNWMQQSWLDYLTPQLYWPFGGGQDYGKLAPWWATQMNGRHLYPGHGLYRADPTTVGSGTLFSSSEIPNQVRFNRQTDGIYGSVFFRAKNITSTRSGGFADTLKADLYRYPAITPTMPWRDVLPPYEPADFQATTSPDGSVELSWRRGGADDFHARTRFFAVYRVRSETSPDWILATDMPENLVAVTSDTTWTDRPEASATPYRYVVTALSPNSVESGPTSERVTQISASSDAGSVPVAFRIDAVYPNPLSARATIDYSLDQPGIPSIDIYDMLGRKVESVASGVQEPAGVHSVTWTPGPKVTAGTYFVLLRIDGQSKAHPVTVVR